MRAEQRWTEVGRRAESGRERRGGRGGRGEVGDKITDHVFDDVKK